MVRKLRETTKTDGACSWTLPLTLISVPGLLGCSLTWPDSPSLPTNLEPTYPSRLSSAVTWPSSLSAHMYYTSLFSELLKKACVSLR